MEQMLKLLQNLQVIYIYQHDVAFLSLRLNFKFNVQKVIMQPFYISGISIFDFIVFMLIFKI